MNDFEVLAEPLEASSIQVNNSLVCPDTYDFSTHSSVGTSSCLWNKGSQIWVSLWSYFAEIVENKKRKTKQECFAELMSEPNVHLKSAQEATTLSLLNTRLQRWFQTSRDSLTTKRKSLKPQAIQTLQPANTSKHLRTMKRSNLNGPKKLWTSSDTKNLKTGIDSARLKWMTGRQDKGSSGSSRKTPPAKEAQTTSTSMSLTSDPIENARPNKAKSRKPQNDVGNSDDIPALRCQRHCGQESHDPKHVRTKRNTDEHVVAKVKTSQQITI